MIIVKNGDILSSTYETIVCPVNCVGVMGAGLALSYNRAFPSLLSAYRKAITDNKLAIGKLWLYRPFNILCFPTKLHYSNPSSIMYIEQGLANFRVTYDAFGIESIAFPALGCGYGQLKWTDVKPVMLKYLENLPIEIEIYEPKGDNNG